MIKKYMLYCNPANEDRRLHIYLPDDYYDSNERYPVIYMFDGHNLYFNEDASFGNCWQLKSFMENYLKKLIIVGIECAAGTQRLREYCPYDVKNLFGFGKIKGYGNEFMSWVIGPLKQHIDTSYRTIPFRECTAVAGSSMGGLMALYAVIAFNQYFSKSAALSPAITPVRRQLKQLISSKQLSEDTRIYFSWGTDEWGGKSMKSMEETVYDFVQDLHQQKIKTSVFRQEGGIHSETSWAEQTWRWMEFHWFS